MKKEWSVPTLEVLHVNMTMFFGGIPDLPNPTLPGGGGLEPAPGGLDS